VGSAVCDAIVECRNHIFAARTTVDVGTTVIDSAVSDVTASRQRHVPRGARQYDG
jgi:hypothetical protein